VSTPTASRHAGRVTDEVPPSHLDLVQCPPVAALTTVSRDGFPQTSVVWCDAADGVVRVSTMRGFAKERNMRRNPRVTLIGYDLSRPGRYLEIRGTVVDLSEEGAHDHLDDIASRYAGRRVRYFGDVIPAAFADTEVPVLCRIRPTDVRAVDTTSDPVSRSVQPLPRAATPILPAGPELALPRSHLDLFRRSLFAVFTTMDADGQPHSCLLPAELDGPCARVFTALERDECRNLLVDPRASLLVVDPDDTSRYLQIRGDAEIVRDMESAGDDRSPDETPVNCRIHARRITRDAIH
jgi:PPOX class probable F420-dependent enzyme